MAETVLEVDSVDTALAIFGNCDENIRLLEQAFGVTAICRGTEVKLTGGEEDVERARRALDAMLLLRAGGTPLEEQTVRYCISLAGSGDEARVKDLTGDFIAITAKGRPVRPKTLGQKAYIGAIVKNAVTFGVGPAGTGKTYLAVAMAVKAFKAREVSRIILTRPAVEAGEKLGFLPGACRIRWTRTCARCMTLCSICWARKITRSCWKSSSSRWLRWPICAGARWMMPSSSLTKRRIPVPNR